MYSSTDSTYLSVSFYHQVHNMKLDLAMLQLFVIGFLNRGEIYSTQTTKTDEALFNLFMIIYYCSVCGQLYTLAFVYNSHCVQTVVAASEFESSADISFHWISKHSLQIKVESCFLHTDIVLKATDQLLPATATRS